MPYIPIVGVIAAVAVLFIVLSRVKGRNYGKEFEEFILEENAANSVKSVALDDSIFFVPNLSGLPVKPDDGGETLSLRRQREVLKRAERKMVRFDAPMTNTELKLKYGTVNLESISAYEENFFSYIYAVNDWAESLIEEGMDDGAEKILRHGVAAGAETSKTYMLLADLYYKHNKRQEMRELYDIVGSKRMPAQEKTWQYLNDYYIKMKL